MIIKFLNNKFNLFFLVFYISLIAGFIFNENSTGGAIVDYINQKKAVNDFANNFLLTFLNYENYGTRHSPVLIIGLSFLAKFGFNDIGVRLIHLHLSLILPFLFIKILKLKFDFKNKEMVYIISFLVFLSPTYRTLSIWPDSRLFGLIFFCISIIYYLKFIKHQKKKYCILNILFYSVSSYISPNFSVFSIFFFYKYFLYFKNDFNFLIKIILVNLILALPAFYYVFILDVNFINQPAAVGFDKKSIFLDNIFNNILLISSIILFYLIPFMQTKIISIEKYELHYSILLLLAIIFTSIYYFNYSYAYTGGGIFYKASYFFFKNNIIFYIISSTSLYMIYLLCRNNKSNLLIFLCLLISNPQITVYHKYYDPLLVILFFSLFDFRVDINKKSTKKYIYIYGYFVIFLLLSIIKINV